MKIHSYLQYALQECSNTKILEELTYASKLFPLWQQWDHIVGEPIISYIYPIGTKKQTLIVGTQDSSSFQEMHYYKSLLLEHVNAFLQEEFFTEVSIQYNTNADSLVQEANASYQPQQQKVRVCPTNISQDILPPTSSIIRAYTAFLTLNSYQDSRQI